MNLKGYDFILQNLDFAMQFNNPIVTSYWIEAKRYRLLIDKVNRKNMLSSPLSIYYLLRISSYVGMNIQFWFCFWHQYHCITVHGNWNPWAGWASCTKICGGGTQQRTRYCNNPAPLYGGNACPGSNTDTQNCNQHNCPGNPLLLLLFRFPSHFQLAIGLFVNKITGKKDAD